MSSIRVDNFSYAYPGSKQPVLDNIALTIPRGEFVLVAGPSGCGKSTLALALTGLIPNRLAGPSRGKVYFEDKCVSEMETHDTAQHIGMVFQNPDNQLVHLDVESDVAFGPENLNLPREVIHQRVKKALAYTHMENYTHSPIYALSGGQKQRVAISATLAMEPDVLVLDEPTSDLDPLGTQEVLHVLKRLNQEKNMTIVLVEHKIDEVLPWVDRVLLMDKGRIVLDGSPRQVFRDEAKWENLGVQVPEMVRLSHQLPEVFHHQTALSVDQAFDALKGTIYHHQLLKRTNEWQKTFGETGLQGPPLLQWEKIDLMYPERHVLKSSALSLSKGEWVALAGPNGSGKTSLASLAMGFQAPTKGQILFKDKAVKAGRISKQAAQIGYLFQAADNMLFASKVRDELQFGKKHQKKQLPNEKYLSAEKLAELLDLGAYLDENPFHLSHGQRKRLAIGALLARKPELMILDEPTTGQDEGHAKAFLEFLKHLREQFDMTYLMITHDMRAAAKYASRLVILNDGRIVLNSSPSQVFAQAEILSEAKILPPPIPNLHGKLCKGHAEAVALNLTLFLAMLRSKEVVV